MLFVSGTKRSGTSMWMQVLVAAGVPVLGKAFPRNWEHASLKEANPDGFYESILRQGIYFRTNPHPTTGQYFLPEHVKGYAVKVFVPGVVRSERAYIDLLVANLREWREYEASINRLYDLENEDRRRLNPDAELPFRFPAAYEWWMENFALVRDLSLRKYPAQLQTYDEVLAHPEKVISRVLGRIGYGDIEKAVAAVKPENRTQERPESTTELDPEDVRVFDNLYNAVAEGKPIADALLRDLNATNRKLIPVLTEMQTKLMKTMHKPGDKPTRAEPVAGLPDLS
jgi:hypothetical protein